MSLSVEFASLRSNLVNLPHSVASSIFNINIPAQKVIVQLDYAKTAYMGWSGLYSSTDNTIEIDPAVAKNLGIGRGDTVKLTLKTSAPVAHVVHLEPVSVEDWSIVESNAAFLENHLINQLRSVTVGQVITVFPSYALMASLKITKIEPSTAGFAFLGSTSEVIVAPKTKIPHSSQQQNAIQSSKNPQSSMQNKRYLVRCTGFVGGRELEIRGNPNTIPFENDTMVLISLAVPTVLAADQLPNEQDVPILKSVLARYIKANVDITSMSYGLTLALGLNKDTHIGAKVIIRQAPEQLVQNLSQKLPRMTLLPYAFSSHSKSVTSKPVRLTQEQIDTLGINFACRGLIVPPVSDSFLPNGGIIDTDSQEFNWGILKEMVLVSETPLAESKRMPFMDLDEHGNQVKFYTQTHKNKQDNHPIVGQDELCSNIVKLSLSGSGILLYGSRGCGKTAVVNEALKALRLEYVRAISFKCSLYTDKALTTVREALKRASVEASWAAPSVVVFDDLDKMIPNQQEHSGDSERQRRLAEVFSNIWRPLIEKGQVTLLATAQDQSAIHSYLLNTHLLDQIVKLRSPDKSLREQIIRTGIDQIGLKEAAGFDVLEIVHETEGYQPGDIWTLVDRVATNIAMRGECGNAGMDNGDFDIVTTEDFLEAKSDYTPVSLRGVKLEKAPTKWSDVGGLKEVKRVVLETLEWPTKYAPVFANCPLRLRSGLLFYGYPGCGKTMLASAIASQTGLNFISVKGPEILNKYIGASEQSVRELFDRAQAAKPCVLFFDEFDSIAPKRGHDSTGVTDRVVNQLLTQMDGAEGLDGVYVLAATSRPDMIDSALLRPGRLDKSLLCDMPTVDDRYDIVLKATKTMRLENGVNLRQVAEATSGFTGADLQALVYNAYLSAVHRSLEIKMSMSESKKQGSFKNFEKINAFQIGSDSANLEGALNYVTRLNTKNITQRGAASDYTPHNGSTDVLVTIDDMAKSLEVSKPSISIKELNRFQEIYAEFRTDRNGEMPPGTSSNNIGGRVTLQ